MGGEWDGYALKKYKPAWTVWEKRQNRPVSKQRKSILTANERDGHLLLRTITIKF